jgi:predicted SnoaL-like aldol condensation-catalyzing enzyme
VKLLSRFPLTALAAVVIMAVGVAVAVAGTQGHSPAHNANHGRHGGPGHQGRCPHGRQLERNKATVVAYYTTAFNDQKPEEAVAKYGGPVYIQHNPQAADGFDAFIGFVKAFTAQYPQLHVDIKRVIAECDLVVTHSHLTLSPTDRGSAVADIFRLDRAGKVVEHWDVIQAVPETSANDNTMF